MIIFLGVLNLDIMSTPLLECLHCVICVLSVTQTDFILLYSNCIMIVHTLKMCTSDAGLEQSLISFNIDMDSFDEKQC